MLVRVVESHPPHFDKIGSVKEVEDQHARTLMLLGKVERVEELQPQPIEAPPAPEPEPTRKQRPYKRRDMAAERIK